MWIGVGGYATAGKDAFADVLEEQGFYRTAMSAPLNEILKVLNPYVRDENGYVARYAEFEELCGYTRIKKIPEVRRLLQVLGTEVGRKMIDPDVWVKLAVKSMMPHPNAAVTGIRFPNEMRLIREHGGLLVWIDRPGVAPVNTHESDNTLTELDFDVVVHNDGSLEDLHEKTRNYLREWEMATA